MNFLQRVEEYIEKYDLLQDNAKVVLGISGGADSVALLLALLESKKQFQVFGVHVNHQIRGEEALADQHFVEELCREKGVPLLVVTKDVPSLAKEQGRTEEEMGRIVRYQAFRTQLVTLGADAIAVAHHKNDQAETVVHHICRGTGVKGLAGIRPKNNEIIRPFLGVTKDEIYKYLKEKGQLYQTDNTNFENEYTRNYIRNQILPELEKNINSQTVAHIAQLAEYMEAVSIFLEKEGEKAWKQCVTEKEDQCVLKETSFCELDKVLQQWVIKKIIEVFSHQHKDIEQVHIINTIALLQKQVGKQVDLPYGIIARRNFEGILLEKKEQNEKTSFGEVVEYPLFSEDILNLQNTDMKVFVREISVEEQGNGTCVSVEEIPKNNCTKWFDYDKIKNTVVFRKMRSQDVMQIDREGHHKQGKRICMEHKMTAEERKHVWVVADGTHLIWIPGVRASMEYYVDRDTKHILEITIDKGN